MVRTGMWPANSFFRLGIDGFEIKPIVTTAETPYKMTVVDFTGFLKRWGERK